MKRNKRLEKIKEGECKLMQSLSFILSSTYFFLEPFGCVVAFVFLGLVFDLLFLVLPDLLFPLSGILNLTKLVSMI